MRRVFYTMFLALVGFGVSAQVSLTPEQVKSLETTSLAKGVIEKGNGPSMGAATADDSVHLHDWAVWVDDWGSLENFNTQDGLLSYTNFPGAPQGVYWDDNTSGPTDASAVFWNSQGMVFDPYDASWFNPDIYSVRDWHSYTIDSIYIWMAYLRRTSDDINDKIIVQTYKGTQINMSSSGKGGKQGTVAYSHATRLGMNFTDSVHVTLQAADSSSRNRETGTFGLKGIVIDIPDITMNAGEKFAVTVNFVPGYEYTESDTLFMDPRLERKIGPLKTPMNCLFIAGYRQSPSVDPNLTDISPLKSYNNGMFLYNSIEPKATSYTGNYYTYTQPDNTQIPVMFYPRIGFKVNADYSVGIDNNDLVNGNGLGNVYPNPANINDQLSLNFKLNSTERVNITVYDLTGKKIQTLTNAQYTQGDHKITFDASNLQAGMYIYTMTAGDFSATKKFNIVK